MSLDRTAQWVQRGIERGWHTSCQVAIVGGNGVETAAWGTLGGTAVTADTPFPLTCLTKPIIATAIGHAADDGLLDLTQPVARYVPAFAGHGRERVTLVELLTHTAALDGDPVPIAGDERGSADRVRTLAPRRTRPRTAAFSAFANWFILAEVLEAASGMAHDRYVDEHILGPLDIDAIDLAPSARSTRPGAAVLDLRGGDLPVDAFRGWFEGIRAWPGVTGLGTAEAVALFFRGILSAVTSDSNAAVRPEVARTLVRPWRVGLHDDVTGDDLTWGLGFTVDARMLGRRVSAATFSHAGLRASSFAFGDPASGAAAAVIYDRVLDPATAMMRHAGTVSAVIHDSGTTKARPG